MHTPRDPVVHIPRRREREVEIAAWNGVLRFRVHEPSPRAALRVMGRVVTVLGPFLVQLLGGQVRLPSKTTCPTCGHQDPEPINGDRWLCSHPGREAEGLPPAIWAREWLVDERGQPLRLTVTLALQDPRWMGMVAQAVHSRLAAMSLDGDQVDDLVCGLLVGALEFQQPGVADWYPIRDPEQLDAQVAQCQDGAAALLRLAGAALETWVFPMVRGALTGTPRDMTANATAGASSPSPRTDMDEHWPAAGRVPPRSAPRRG